MSLLQPNEIREWLGYEPSTGVLTWRKAKTSWRIGKEAGTLHSEGYTRVMILGRFYYAHRIAWAYVHNRWPALDIDHINGNRRDNRIANLREVSREINCQNLRSARSDCHSGLLGAHRTGVAGKWRATIRVSGKFLHIGTFNSPEDAHHAYVEAKRALHPGGLL